MISDSRIIDAGIEEIGEALIREYLSRKGFRSTLKAFEAERVSRLNPFTTRKELCDSLMLEDAMRANKLQRMVIVF